jgi:preprotein translocase subunit SecF
MSLALLVLYIAVIVGFLWNTQVGGVLAIVALNFDLANLGGHVNL